MTADYLNADLAKADSLYRQGLLEQACGACARILATHPDLPNARLLMGCIEFKKDNADLAILHLRHAAKFDPESARIRDALGRAFFLAGKFDAAAAEFGEGVRLQPNNPGSLYRLGLALRKGKNNLPSEKALRAAIALQPDFEDAEQLLINILLVDNRVTEAIQRMEDLLLRHPGNMGMKASLVVAYERANRLEDAERAADQYLEEAPGNPHVEMIKAVLEGRRGDLEQAERRLRRLIETGNTVKKPMVTYFRLGEVLDRRGAYAEAFESFVTSKRLQAAGIGEAQRKAGDYAKFVAANASWMNKVSKESAPQLPEEKFRAPIFFIAFPRSGTTLMETILAAHPDVITTEEHQLWGEIVHWIRKQRGTFSEPEDLSSLTSQEIAGARAKYMELAERKVARPIGQSLLVDKLPLNIVRLPLIRTIFPECRVIMALRDPRDVCLSCFFQPFKLNWAMEHFLDIQSTARLYSEVMQIWLTARDRELVNSIEYRYENLVQDVPAVTENILHFIGLEWNDEILRHTEISRNKAFNTPSYQAVTKPVRNKAVGRWRNYASELAPILPMLEPFVKEFGYEPS